ncbi:MAG: hypothetical protein J6K03_00575 [Oscillospiraceae bacterium]|nr:hypothetical protein [Oscillospiraceae bacterium]
MKKWLSFLLCACMALTLAACGEQNEPAGSNPSQNTGSTASDPVGDGLPKDEFDENGKPVKSTVTQPDGTVFELYFADDGSIEKEQTTQPNGDVDATSYVSGVKTEFVQIRQSGTYTLRYRADGSIAEKLDENADGSSKKQTYDASGTLLTEDLTDTDGTTRSTVYYGDGSKKTTTYPAEGRPYITNYAVNGDIFSITNLDGSTYFDAGAGK